MKRLAVEADQIDLREVIITDPVMELDSSKGDMIEKAYTFRAMLGSEELGYFSYDELRNHPANSISMNIDSDEPVDALYVVNVNVNKKYQNLGIGQMMYKKFGEVYNSQYSGWPVARFFMNPIAEYAFRKAVALGWIQETSLSENYIRRSQTKYDKNLGVDLRNKLPDSVKGPIWADIRNKLVRKAEDSKIDLRNLVINESILRDSKKNEDGSTEDEYAFNATINGKVVGGFLYSEMHNYPAGNIDDSLSHLGVIENLIYIGMVRVNEDYRSLGIGQLLYKKFGEIYNSKYNNWPVSRYFMNPIAEYAFRKAVALGWISENSLTESYIVRNKSRYNNDLATDLRNKLPENVRGPYWANRNSRSIFAAGNEIDLRSLVIDDPEKEYGDKNQTGYIIRAYLNSNQIAFLQYNESYDIPGVNLGPKFKGQTIDEMLYVDLIEVHDEYRNLGIGQLLYKKFGEVYNKNYQGWPVGRFFANPVAEYSFRKAVSLGWISESALSEDFIDRNYPLISHRELAKDLRQKLPENVRGPETWAVIRKRLISLAESESIDIRSLEITDPVVTFTFEDSDDIRYAIYASLNGQNVGSFAYNIQSEFDDDYEKHKYIFIDNVRIKPEYRNLGIGQLLYKKFGEVYNSQFNGIPIKRYFINPIAEYSFRKAVALGWITETALNESNMKRDYDSYGRDLAKDLRQKLPENVRGPETWASYNKRLKRKGEVTYTSDWYDTDLKPEESDKPELDWDQIEINVQNTPREENKQNADTVVDHEIYCEYYGDQIGYMHFTEFHNVDSHDVHPEFKSKKYENFLYINNVLVNTDFRGYGIGKKLYEKFGEMYKEQFNDYPVAQVFVNPVAEYVFTEEVKDGNIPESAYSDDLIARQYDEKEKQLAKDLFDWLPDKEQEKFKQDFRKEKVKNEQA